MKQQMPRPIRRTEQQRHPQDKEGVWPLSAREFMKLPATGLLQAGTRIQLTRLTPPDQAA